MEELLKMMPMLDCQAMMMPMMQIVLQVIAMIERSIIRLAKVAMKKINSLMMGYFPWANLVSK